MPDPQCRSPAPKTCPGRSGPWRTWRHKTGSPRQRSASDQPVNVTDSVSEITIKILMTCANIARFSARFKTLYSQIWKIFMNSSKTTLNFSYFHFIISKISYSTEEPGKYTYFKSPELVTHFSPLPSIINIISTELTSEASRIEFP